MKEEVTELSEKIEEKDKIVSELKTKLQRAE